MRRKGLSVRALAPVPGLVFALAPAAAWAADGAPAASLDQVVWEFIRASGLVAYALLSVSVFMGIAVRTRALDVLMKRAWVYESHQFLSLLALAFTGLHVWLLLVNGHIPFSLSAVLVPFASDWRPLPAAVGTVSAYLVAALVVSSYLRGRIGQRAWRTLHYSGFAAWALALIHGLAAGSDTGLLWVQYGYLITGAAVGFLVAFRVLTPAQVKRAAPRPSRIRDRA